MVARPVRTLFAAFAVSTLILLSLAFVFLGEVTAIKGSYALLGILLAGALYGGRSSAVFGSHGRSGSGSGSTAGASEASTLAPTDRIGRWATKALFVLVTGAYLVTYITGERFEVTVVALVLGYSMLAYQLFVTGPTRAVIPQIGLLFTVGPVTKYLSTGFYYGDSDLLSHVRAVELLYETGQLESIAIAYATYDQFPGLHLLSGAISSFTGLPAYDSLIVLGILTYLVMTVAVYYFCRAMLSPSQSVMVTVAFSILVPIQYHATYFFPQAFATALVVLLIYVVVRRRSASDSYHGPLSLVTVLVVAGLILAHHVTQIIFAGLVVAMYVPSALQAVGFGRKLEVNADVPRFVPILLAVTAGLTHLIVSPTGIVNYFIEFTAEKAENPFVSDAGGERTVFGFGTDIPFHTPQTAVESVFYVDGLYYIGLAALFVAGVAVLFARYRDYARIAGFALLGLVGSLFVLKTPFVNLASRVSLPLAFFFAIVVGIGLWYLARASGELSGRVGLAPDNRPSARRVALIAVVVLVAVTGPLAAGDDLYGLHAGPNLWETYSTPEQQVEFSDQELGEIEATVGYVDRHSEAVTMLWITREASERFGGEERDAPTEISTSGIRTDSPFVYRTKWTEHQVGYSTDVPGTLSMADWWLYREIDASNKVYTSGMVGVLWEQEIHLSNNRTSEQWT